MARSFRFYEKKRGHRRTGSRQIGRIGELIFFSSLLLIGLVGMAVTLWTVVVPEWRANHEFVEHQCVVLDKRLGEHEGENGRVYRPEFQIEYEVAGAPYRVWTYDIAGAYSNGREAQLAVLDEFVVDRDNPRRYACWYDPLDPGVAVLVRGYRWWMWSITLVWVAFILIGAGGLVYTWLHWGKSAERRAAFAQRVRPAELFANGRAKPEFPFVPEGGDITNSPGTRLKFRLPIGTSPAWLVFAALTISVIWNGIVVVWAVLAVNAFRRGQPDWWLTLFLVPFAAAGVGLLAWFVRQLLIATGVGPTHVEISDHPLAPGGSYQLFIVQPGRLTFNALSVALVCEEEATYRQGTNTRTESCEVFRLELSRRESFAVRSGALEADIEFVVPPGAMHSFKAPNNAISWKVVVHGDVAGWPDFTRTFPVILKPAPRSDAR